MPKMLNPDSAAGNKRLKIAAKKKTAKPKAKGMPGDQFTGSFEKPSKSRRKFLNQINKMNKEAGY